MHSFARHTLLLMVKQRACSGSRDERRGNVALSSSRRSPKPVRHSEWLRHFSRIVLDSDPRARATSSSRSGPFPRSVTCGPLERALTKCTLLRKHLRTSRTSRDVLTSRRECNLRLVMRFFALNDHFIKIASFHTVGLTVNEFYAMTWWHIL